MDIAIDKRAASRILGAILGGVLGIVVAFTFGFAKPETVPHPIRYPRFSVGGPAYENIPAGYGLKALYAASVAAFVLGVVGWAVGDEAGKHLYPSVASREDSKGRLRST